MSELKPCPFCGKPPRKNDVLHLVSCDFCMASGIPIHKWNIRETNTERALKEAKGVLLDCENGYRVFHAMLLKVELTECVLTTGEHLRRIADYTARIAAIERGEA